MKVRYPLTQSLYACVMAFAISAAAHAQPASPQQLPGTNAVRFIENRGQIAGTLGDLRPDVLYTAASGNVKVYFRNSGVSYVFLQVNTPAPKLPSERPSPQLSQETTITTYRMDMELLGANPSAAVVPEDQSSETINYYTPRFPNGITGIRSFGRLVYRDIYPNIDLVFYGNGAGMKYDFVVRPGGNVEDIRLRYIGADSIRSTGSGTVIASNPLGSVEEGAIYSYQPVAAYRASATVPQGSQQVHGSYEISNGVISFDLPSYDPARPLVIDPPLLWSTYCGGSSNDVSVSWNHGSTSIDVDRNVLITGSAASSDFPVTAGAFQTSRMGANFTYDAYVVKFNADGSRKWATYFGGSQADNSYGITTDANKNVIFVGITGSSDFPVSDDAFRRRRTSLNDGFIVKLDSNGSRSWATYFPNGTCSSVAADAAGNILIGGTAISGLVTTSNAFQPRMKGYGPDGFIAKFSSSGQLRWSTYYGGSSPSEGVGSIATDDHGSVLVSGYTMSTDFPVSENTFQQNFAGGTDAFIIKLDSNGNRSWATYFGGGGYDYGYGIATDRTGSLVFTGYTSSTDLPTLHAFQTQNRGGNDGFVARFDGRGNRLWATYFGGSSQDYSYNIAVDNKSNIWTTGYTLSTNFPVTPDAYQRQIASPYASDAAVLQIDSNGQRVWATYLGGVNYDYATGIAISPVGIVVSGTTSSSDLPTSDDAFQLRNAGSFDAFITQFCNVMAASITVNGIRELCNGDSTVLMAPPGFPVYLWSTGETTQSITVKQSGRYSVSLGVGGCYGTTDVVNIVVHPMPSRVIGVIGSAQLCEGDSAILTPGKGLLSYRWSTGDTTPYIVVREARRFTVSFTDSNGCVGRSDTLEVTMNPRPKPVVTAAGKRVFCEGDSVVLDAGPGYRSYMWSNGETTQQISARVSGQYSVRVANEAGCWGESAPLTVRALPAPRFRIAPLLPTAFCEGDSTVLTASSAFASYRWSTGDTTKTITVRKGGRIVLTAFNENGCSSSATITTEIAPYPSPTILPSRSPRICEGENVVLDAGDGYSSYYWSTGQRTQRVTVTEPGLYSVTVTNTLGCPGTSNVIKVEVLPKPSTSISGPLAVCLKSRAVYRAPADPALSYEWKVSGGEIESGWGTSSITVKWGSGGIGKVQLSVRNPGSICATDTMLIVDVGGGLVPMITAQGPTSLCQGGSVVLDAGEGYTRYSWSTNETTRTITVDRAGIYTVTVTDAGGCIGVSKPAVVEQSAMPQPKITALGNTTFCAGGSVTLDAGPGYSRYKWSNGATVRQIVVDDANTYTVIVTNAGGCEAISPPVATVVTPLPSPSIAGPGMVCLGVRATYSAPEVEDHKYYWTPVGGTLISEQGLPTAIVEWNGEGAGRLDLQQESPDGSCVASTSAQVMVASSLQPQITSAGPTAICEGKTVTLDAGAGYAAYKWSNGATGRTIAVDRAGAYWVTVTADGGCSGSSAPIVVTTRALPLPAVVALGPTEFCEGESVILEAPAGFARYRWSNGATSRVIEVSAAGTYSVGVADDGECEGISLPVDVVVHPMPAQPKIAANGDLLTAPDAAEYQWYFNGRPVPGGRSRQLLAADTGAYAVTISNAGGCSATSEAFFFRRTVAPAIAHKVGFGTASAHVGNRFRMSMSVDPALASEDDIRGFRAWIRIPSRSLFLHRAISPDAGAPGEYTSATPGSDDRIVIDRAASSPLLTGNVLFELELEGLSTGVPLNRIIIDSVVFSDGSRGIIGGDGTVILSGCDVGRSFDYSKRVRLQSIRPNPVSHEAAILYRAPAGAEIAIRLVNTTGQEVMTGTLPPGTGEEQEIWLPLGSVDSGVYMLELRDGSEISTMPLVIQK